MLTLTQVCEHRPVALQRVQSSVFEVGPVLHQKNFSFLQTVGAKSLVHHKGPRGTLITKKLGGTFIGGNHALLNQMLGREFLVAVDLGDLFVIPQHPPILATLLHHQLALLASLAQRSIHLHQRFQRVGMRNQIVAVARDVAIDCRVGQLRARANNRPMEGEALDLS